MTAYVEYSNFGSGYAWPKCSACDWKGQKQIGAGPLSNRLARKEADAHDAEHHAPEPEEDELELCEHGLSAWLCAGPMHYPADHGLPF